MPEQDGEKRRGISVCDQFCPLSPFLPALHPRLPRRSGFTLLEVMLALGLAVVVLGLVGMGIHVQLAVAAKSRDQVEEAQLARVLLQRIADDLRNAVPFQPPPSSARRPRRPRLRPAFGTGRRLGQLPTRPLPPARRIPTAPRRFPAGFTARPRRSRSRRRGGRGQPSRRCRWRPATPASPPGSAIFASYPTASGRRSPSICRKKVPRRLRAPASIATSRIGPSFSTPRKMARPTIPIRQTELLAPEVVDFQLTYYGGTGGTASSGATSGGTARAERHGQQRHDERRHIDRRHDDQRHDERQPMGFDATGHVARRREDYDFPPPRRAEIVARPSRHREAAAGRVLLARQSAQCERGYEPGRPSRPPHAAQVDGDSSATRRRKAAAAGAGGRGGGERRRR